MEEVGGVVFTFSPLARRKSKTKRGTFWGVLGVSLSADSDGGLCPLDPCKPLKRLEPNFYEFELGLI